MDRRVQGAGSLKNSKRVQKLQRQIRGRVTTPGDPEYLSVVQIDNGRIRLQPPMAVIASSVDDVVLTVNFARNEGLRITTKCGGHSAAGYCLNDDGIVLDLRNLNDISLNREAARLRIGMGLRWKQVYDYIEAGQSGLMPIGGGCAGVGVAGFLSAGGYSFASRSYGLGSDSVVSLRIVTPDGKTCDLGQGGGPMMDDLFWAGRGGGGGNFGVLVSGELQLHKPHSGAFLVGQIQFPFYRVSELLPFYNRWVEKELPKEMAVYGFVGLQPNPKAPNQQILSLRFTPVYNGNFAEGIELLQPLFKQKPMASALYEMTMPEWENFIGTGTVINGRSAYIRSLVLPENSMDVRAARVLMKYMSRAPSPDTFIVWTHAGGKIGVLADEATAFPHRHASFVPEIKAIWDPTRSEDMRRNVEWAYEFFEEWGQLNGAGAYLNYIDPLLVDWPSKYYGRNYSRLLKIKQKWDPDSVFAFQQGIGSKFRPSSTRPLDLSPLGTT